MKKINRRNEPVRSMLTNTRNPVAWAWWAALLVNGLIFAFQLGDMNLPQYFDDSWSYRDTANVLLTGHPGAWRTPLYPILLGLCGTWWGWNEVLTMDILLVVQIAIFMTALPLVAKIAVSLGAGRNVAALILFVTGGFPGAAFYGVVSLPESLCITAGIIFLWYSLRLCRGRRLRDALWILSVTLALLLLKPVFIFLLPMEALLFGIVFRHRLKAVAISIGGIGVICGLIAGYAEWEYRSYGYRGLSHANIVNNYALLLEGGLIGPEDFPDDRFKEFYTLNPRSFSPGKEWYMWVYCEKHSLMPEFAECVSNTMRKNPQKVFMQELRRFPTVMSYPFRNDYDYISINYIPDLPVGIYFVSGVMLLFMLPWLGNRLFWTWTAGITLAIFGVAWFGAMGDWGRLTVPGWSWMTLCLCGVIIASRTMLRRVRRSGRDLQR